MQYAANYFMEKEYFFGCKIIVCLVVKSNVKVKRKRRSCKERDSNIVPNIW